MTIIEAWPPVETFDAEPRASGNGCQIGVFNAVIPDDREDELPEPDTAARFRQLRWDTHGRAPLCLPAVRTQQTLAAPRSADPTKPRFRAEPS